MPKRWTLARARERAAQRKSKATRGRSDSAKLSLWLSRAGASQKGGRNRASVSSRDDNTWLSRGAPHQETERAMGPWSCGGKKVKRSGFDFCRNGFDFCPTSHQSKVNCPYAVARPTNPLIRIVGDHNFTFVKRLDLRKIRSRGSTRSGGCRALGGAESFYKVRRQPPVASTGTLWAQPRAALAPRPFPPTN